MKQKEKYMTAFESMNRTELQSKLEQLKDQLEEVLDERSLVIGQQNGHVSSKYISKQAVKFASEIDELNDSIVKVQQLLSALN